MPRDTPQALVELERRLHRNRVEVVNRRHDWDVADAIQVFQDWLRDIAGPVPLVSPLEDTEQLREMLLPIPLPSPPVRVLELLPLLHPLRATLGRQLRQLVN